ncbi:MAG: type II toxin-antitoxin system VapC family toxin [Thermosynechococcaceae cyanobacterium]
MAYLLDTCVISDFARGDTNTLQKLKSVLPHQIYVASVTCMEVSYGLRLNPSRAVQIRPVIDRLLASITVLPFDVEEAQLAAQIRSTLKSAGKPIGAYDVLIAATALAHDLTIVTSNTREFHQISGLKTENWR